PGSYHAQQSGTGQVQNHRTPWEPGGAMVAGAGHGNAEQPGQDGGQSEYGRAVAPQPALDGPQHRPAQFDPGEEGDQDGEEEGAERQPRHSPQQPRPGVDR